MDRAEIGEHIKNLLLDTAGAKAHLNNVFICCPFHAEHTPSLSVVIAHDQLLPGTFHCFGCNQSGNWNKLAAALKVEFRVSLSELQAEMKATVTLSTHQPLELPITTTSQFLKTLNLGLYTPWGQEEDWRKVKASFLHAIDAYRIYDQEEQKILLPVKVQHLIVGGIRASLTHKQYATTPGAWVKSKGLFPYDYAQQVLRNPYWNQKFVILVEGPRDAARLLTWGVPALAILGSNQWSPEKMNLLLAFSAADFEVILMFDSDAAGVAATFKIKAQLHSYFKVRVVQLPKFSSEHGTRVKCDVFNLPLPRLRKFITQLQAVYGHRELD